MDYPGVIRPILGNHPPHLNASLSLSFYLYHPPRGLDGEISKYVDILQGVAHGCTVSPIMFNVYINDLIMTVEAAKQGVTMGDDTVSGFMVANDFVGIAETPQGLQK